MLCLPDPAVGEFPEEVAPVADPAGKAVLVDGPRESTPKYNIYEPHPDPNIHHKKSRPDQRPGRRKEGQEEKAELDKKPNTIHTNNPQGGGGMNDGIIGIIIGVLAVLIVLFIIIFILVFLRRKRRYRKGHESVKIGHELPYHFNEEEFFFTDTHKKSVNTYNFVNGSDVESEKDTVSSGLPNGNGDVSCTSKLLQRQLPELPPTPISTGTSLPPHLYPQVGNYLPHLFLQVA